MEFYAQRLEFSRQSMNVSILICYGLLHELVHFSVAGGEEEFERLTFSSAITMVL